MRRVRRQLSQLREAIRRFLGYERTPEPGDSASASIPRDVLDSAEDAVNASFGLPPVWRCRCGGRPFTTQEECPRCGRRRVWGDLDL